MPVTYLTLKLEKGVGMKRKGFIFKIYPARIFIVAFLGAFTLFIDQSTAGGKVWGNDQISITLNKIERVNKMPDNIPPYLRATPKPGNDFAVVYLSVTRLKSVFLTSSDCALFDVEGHEYQKTLKAYTGAKPREKPTPKSSLYFKEGATFTFFHALPINAEPAFLRFSYSFVKSLKESNEEEGQIEIKIFNSKQ